jgi:hypothetical protein
MAVSVTRESEFDMGTFIVPAPATPTVRALSDVAARRGFLVVPVALDGRVTVVPTSGRLHLFGGPRLAARVQDQSPLALLEPRDDWLPNLPERFVRRRVRLMPALEAYGLGEQWFVKMPREKGLEPGPYHGYELPTLPEDEPLLISDIVTMTDEYRFWILDGVVHASSSYRLNGRPDGRQLGPEGPVSLYRFMDDLLTDQADHLPSAVVVDVAWLSQPSPGWAVVEANMAWFSSHYAADPERVLDVVLRAAGPPSAVSARDAGFCRRAGGSADAAS